MIRRLWKTLKLGFDRSFSGASWKQITWLFGILALVLGFSLWIKSYCTAELHDMRILELLLDPGSFVLQDGDPLGYERLPLLALTFLGAIFFTGGLISVVSNILTGRIARFRQGEIRYRFDGHIVLLGANDTAAGLIRELHAEPENRRRASCCSRRAMRRPCAGSCTPNFRPPRSAVSSSSTASATRAKHWKKSTSTAPPASSC